MSPFHPQKASYPQPWELRQPPLVGSNLPSSDFLKNQKRNANLHKGAWQICAINRQRNGGLLPQTGKERRNEVNTTAGQLSYKKKTSAWAAVSVHQIISSTQLSPCAAL